MALGASVAPTAVGISRCSSPRAQGIQRQPVTINTVSAFIPATGTYWIMLFHLPNIFSIQPVKGSLMPEFSANSNLRDCNYASNPSRAVLLGIKLAYNTLCLSHLSLLALSITFPYIYIFLLTLSVRLNEVLLIMIHVIYLNNIYIHNFYMVDKQNRTNSTPAVIWSPHVTAPCSAEAVYRLRVCLHLVLELLFLL